ncbi:MAG TPA: class I SAM-dependent methyltransferase [Stellaceae bacterium]|nr:class I SAM-dependent methyltransferase [Stellaceae bacterium]
MRTLSHEEARAFYDWFGARQDSQGFYEDPALSDLLAHADFGESHSVFEFGCGTGRFAERLLSSWLPSDGRYQATEISATMVRLAQARLAPWGERAHVVQTSGAISVPASDASFDRFIVCYVLDLLSEPDIRQLLAEAHRVLIPDGLLCLAGSTRGASLSARIVGVLWQTIFRLQPKLVGGCRAIVAREYLGDRDWAVHYANVVTHFGISSEVLVARTRTG